MTFAVLARLATLIALSVASTALFACGDDDSSPSTAMPDSGPNLLLNGGFEDGRDPWFVLKPPDWILTNQRARSGNYSAYLKMRDTAASEETMIYYLVQEVPTAQIPEVLSGTYMVENWVRGTKNQYLQFVVILMGSNFEGFPPCPDGNPCPNYQIRYLLSGIAEDPFPIANAKFVYISTEDPVQGQWVPFQRNLRDDFKQAWGTDPGELDQIRVLFEVRYDKKAPQEGPLEADVYYDDLYMGPADQQ
jgi:hypothetical protein